MTISEAVIHVLKQNDKALTINEIYDAITAGKLFIFKTSQPRQVLRAQIRKHCVGFDSPAASSNKYFESLSGNSYRLRV